MAAQSKNIYVGGLLLLTLLLLGVALGYKLLHTVPSAQIQPTTNSDNRTSDANKKSNSPELTAPQRIELPTLSVAAPVVGVGLTQDNDMDVDDDIATTAWYKLGPKPGEKGSAVIAGHYGVKNGEEAVFSQLKNLVSGDAIYVYDENDTKLTFIVRETRMYDREADATDVFRSYDGGAHLNLITCEGAWNGALQTYSDRLVVFADLAQEQ